MTNQGNTEADTERLAAALSDAGLIGPIDISGQGDMFATALGGRGTEAAICKTCGAMILLNSPLYDSPDPAWPIRLHARWHRSDQTHPLVGDVWE